MAVVLLTDAQIDIVANRLEREGLRYEVLKLELLDHICCQIEGRLADGISFDDALEVSLAEFGPQPPQKVESDIISTLNHPHILMQKLMLTGGGLTAIFLLFFVWATAQEVPSLKPVDMPIISEFGMRIHPQTKKKQLHTGVDIRADEGTPIYSPADGTIDFAGVDEKRSKYGILIEMTHGKGFQTRYAHLSKVEVKAGDKVKQGVLIGYTGNSGYSLGPHLHYEVRKDGKPVDPEEYFGQEE